MSSDAFDDPLPTPRPSTQVSSLGRLSTATIGSLPRYSALGDQIHGGLPFGSPYGPVQLEDRDPDGQTPPRYSLVASGANGGALPHLEHIFSNHSDGIPWATLHTYSRASMPTTMQGTTSKPPVPVYYGGDTVAGVLVLNLSAPQTIQQIVVSLRGKIVTPFLDGGSYVFFSYDKLIWDRIEGDPNRSAGLPAGPSPQAKKKKWDGKLQGNYRFPFAFPVPSYGDLVSSTGVLPETMATPFSLSSTPTFSTPSSPSLSNNSRSGTPLHSHPVPIQLAPPGEKRRGFGLARAESSSYMTPSSAFSSPISQSPSSTTSRTAYRVWEKPSASGLLASQDRESASDNSSALNYESDGDSQLEPQRTVNRGISVNADKPLPSLPPSSPSSLSSKSSYQDDKTPTPNSTWETANKPLLSPLPQSYIEKDAKITVQYDLSVQMAHGWLTSDTNIRTRITYLPSSAPPPMSSYRLRAYQEAEALDAGAVPSPLVDPTGWHILPDVTFEGVFSGYDYEVKVKYSLSIARPLSYTRGTHIPLHLAISISALSPRQSTISSAIKEGMTDPSTLSVRLTRRLRYFYPSNGNGSVCASLNDPGAYAAMGAGGGFIAVGSNSAGTLNNSAKTFEEEKIGLKEKGKGKRKGRMHSNILGVAGARWWKVKEDVFLEQAREDVTFLRGEICLDKVLQPSSACPLFNLEYYLELMTPFHPRFEDSIMRPERTEPSLGHRTTPSNLPPTRSNLAHMSSPSMVSLATSGSSGTSHTRLKKSPSMTTFEERRPGRMPLRTLASHPVEITALCREEEKSVFDCLELPSKDHSHEDLSTSRRGNWWERC